MDISYLEIIYNLLTKANIICEVGKEAEVFEWNRYIFYCAFNITDSYYDVGGRGILEDKMKFELEVFGGDLCRIGKDVGVPTPYARKAYQKLKILQPM